jgi:hypothetical protein
MNAADLKVYKPMLSAWAFKHCVAMLARVDHYRTVALQPDEIYSLAMSHCAYGALRQLETFIARELGQPEPATTHAPLGDF